MADNVNIEVIQPGNLGHIASTVLMNMSLEDQLDPRLMRPWVETDKQGRVMGAFVTNVAGRIIPVNNATLRKDEWVEYDKALVMASKLRYRGIADLVSRGLVYNIGNGFAKTVFEYEKMSELGEAQVNMDAVPQPENDRLTFTMGYLPLYIISKGFQINARALAASRSGGSSIDTAQAYEAAMMVADKQEDILFNGLSSYAFAGHTVYGYRDFPDRITGSFLNGHWDDLTVNSVGSIGEQILADVLAMKEAAVSHRKYGPYVLYIPRNFESVLEQDYVTGYPGSIRERLMKISNLTDIIVADKMTADCALLVQMTPDTVRLVNGLPLTNLEWQSLGGMVHNYRVMTIQVPQIRSDSNGNCGVVHYT